VFHGDVDPVRFRVRLSGKTNPTLVSLATIARALKVTTAEAAGWGGLEAGTA
jgi:hypothetical protein